MTVAYPLQWPPGQPRTSALKQTRNYSFKTSQERAQKNVMREVGLLGGTKVVISTNIPVRRDGLPYADASRRTINDVGVAVYFALDGEQMCFACDKWDNFSDNMHSISLTIGALRGIERWGSGHMMKQAFRGFTALPAPEKGEPWHEVLGFEQYAAVSREDIDDAFKTKAKLAHPDRGGSHAEMARLNRARDEGYKALDGIQ